MNREIKFRGKRVDNDEWVYGSLIYDVNEKWYIHQNNFVFWAGYCEIIPETIGQYTGLKDKNGKEIYEGDIVEYNYIGEDEETARHYPKKGVINFKDNGWHINNKWLDGYTMRMFKFEVIGNIYEVEDGRNR